MNFLFLFKKIYYICRHDKGVMAFIMWYIVTN